MLRTEHLLRRVRLRSEPNPHHHAVSYAAYAAFLQTIVFYLSSFLYIFGIFQQ